MALVLVRPLQTLRQDKFTEASNQGNDGTSKLFQYTLKYSNLRANANLVML